MMLNYKLLFWKYRRILMRFICLVQFYCFHFWSYQTLRLLLPSFISCYFVFRFPQRFLLVGRGNCSMISFRVETANRGFIRHSFFKEVDLSFGTNNEKNVRGSHRKIQHSLRSTASCSESLLVWYHSAQIQGKTALVITLPWDFLPPVKANSFNNNNHDVRNVTTITQNISRPLSICSKDESNERLLNIHRIHSEFGRVNYRSQNSGRIAQSIPQKKTSFENVI